MPSEQGLSLPVAPLQHPPLPDAPGQDPPLPPHLLAQLDEVMARQVAFSTGMESESVPRETAADLLASVLFNVRTALDAGACPQNATLADLLLAGQRLLYQHYTAGKRLLAKTRVHCLPLQNPMYQEVLADMDIFFTWYDIRLFAHQIPSMIDYPLALPVPESLLGVHFITQYLQQRLWEDSFCRRFPLSEVQGVLERHNPLYRELPLNLFEPVLVNALGHTLLDSTLDTLTFTPAQRAGLAQKVGGLSPARLTTLLQDAAARLCNRLRIWESASRRYYTTCAAATAARLQQADEEGLAHLFV